MLRRLRSRLTYANVVGTMALFVAVGTGGAYAANTVFSSDIVDGEVKSVDIGNNEIASGDIKDNTVNTFDVHSFIGDDVIDGTLTGADVDEATLGTVPSSVLGGLGRMGVLQNGQPGPGACDPESGTFINCDMVATLTLARPARIFVTGSIVGVQEVGTQLGLGSCQLGTTSGAIPGTTLPVTVAGGDFEQLGVSGITGVFPAGQHSFGIDCNETSPIRYQQARVSAVALSDQ
jgi:hypothetical protein